MLSKRAVYLLQQALQFGSCPTDGTLEDLDIAKCLATVDVFPEETRDSSGRITFHSINPYAILAGDPALGNFYTYSIGNITFGYRHVC